MKRVIILCAVLLTGCGSASMLENRVTCTVDKSEAHVVSKWGPVGVASKIAASDARVMCQR